MVSFRKLMEGKDKDVVSLIKRDCKQYLKIFKSVEREECLFKGSDSIRKDDIIKIKSRLDNRIPRNTDKEIHDYLNKLFKDMFGWNVRNGVFVTPAHYDAELYGDVCLFFPIGNFKYVWSPEVNDLTRFISSRTNLTWDVTVSKIISSYTDKHFKDIFKEINNPEVSFNCKEYYLVRYYDDDMILRIKND